MGDEKKWSRNDKIAFSSLVVGAVGCIAALIVVPELRHYLGLDRPALGINRGNVHPGSSRTPTSANNQTENGKQATVTPAADSGLVKRLAPDALPDQSYLAFGRILRVGFPEHFSRTNPHHVAQYDTFLYKEGDADGLLKTVSFVRRDRHFTLEMMYPSRAGNELLRFRGEIIYLKFVGFEEKENYTWWYYSVVSSSGNNFDLQPWIQIVRSKDSGNCLLRYFEPDGLHNLIPAMRQR